LLSLDPTFEDYFNVLESYNPNVRIIIQTLLNDWSKEFPQRASPFELEAAIDVWESPENWEKWFNYPQSIPHFLISSLKVTESQLRGNKEIVDARYRAQQRTIKNSDTKMQIGLIDAGHWVHSDQPQLTMDTFRMLINLVRNRNNID
jgi:hypothetical protein